LTIIVVERASPGLRGQLTRWMIEVRAGVFVGTLSSRVREKLWMLTESRNPKGGSLLVYRAQNEQGFVIESHGDTSREVIDIEGLLLVRRPWDDAPKGGRRGTQHSDASLGLQKATASK
jgi:CRISPR-associated protein Cas2